MTTRLPLTYGVWSAATIIGVVLSGAFFASPCADADGIAMITHGPPDVGVATNATDNQKAAYGIGIPFQVGPGLGGVLCNLRTIGPKRGDYEDGTDLFLFDSMGSIGSTDPVPLSRNEKEPDPETGKPRVIVKFPLIGGFVPLGAKRADGSPHPAAGTGFGVCQALSFIVDGEGLFTWSAPWLRYLEVMQLAYDGADFTVTDRTLIREEKLLHIGESDWHIIAPGLTFAIPDGDDLISPLLAKGEGASISGSCRWRWVEGQWQPVSFAPVTRGSEASMVRDADGSLLFAVRRGGKEEGSLVTVWRSEDAGESWSEVVNAPDIRTSSPIGINASADGTPFIAANLKGTNRTRLSAWALNAERSGLEGPRIIRDGDEEFGPAPEGTFWAIDHPSSATIQLADGNWHGVLGYRLLAFPKGGREEPVIPQTGCCVEEIISTGPPIPAWQF